MTDIGLSPRTQEILSAALEETRQGLDAIGGLDALLHLHKGAFGTSKMEGDDDDDTGGAGDDDEDAAGGGDGDDDDDSGDAEDKRDPKKKISALQEEKDRHVKRRKAAERERDEAKAELEKLQNADKSEVEQAAAKVPTLEKQVSSLEATNRDLALQVAFLKDNTFEWHNPSRALQMVDMSEVEIDEDGKVSGLDSALKALAKSDAYLVKPKKSKDDDGDAGPAGQQSTGDTNNGRRGKGKEPDKNALQSKYPGLRR